MLIVSWVSIDKSIRTKEITISLFIKTIWLGSKFANEVNGIYESNWLRICIFERKKKNEIIFGFDPANFWRQVKSYLLRRISKYKNYHKCAVLVCKFQNTHSNITASRDKFLHNEWLFFLWKSVEFSYCIISHTIILCQFWCYEFDLPRRHLSWGFPLE